MRLRIFTKLKTIHDLLPNYLLFVFYTFSIIYFELVYRLWSFKSINYDFIFPELFAVSAGTVLFFLSGFFSERVNRIAAIFLTLLLVFIYGLQLVYYSVFNTPLSLYSLTGAGDALKYKDIVTSAILENVWAIVLLLVPLVVLLAAGRRFMFSRLSLLSSSGTLLFCIVSYAVTIFCVNLTGDSSVSQRALYYKASSPVLSAGKLGILTTMRLDFQRLVFKFDYYSDAVAPAFAEASTAETTTTEVTTVEAATAKPAPDEPASIDLATLDAMKADNPTPVPAPAEIEAARLDTFNIMDIDFKALIASEKNKTLLDMHKYFSTVEPTKKNKFTGAFKGNNLILITAEAFSPYTISPDLTPTLYRMSREGFVFKNFYNPIWEVSTSDGEYVACTGLLPKSGIWSFARSGRNYMPFVMGNQFKKLGYPVRAYHNHTYTYYKRNISHPNMGYDYKGIGSGLNIEKSWPESDLEMIEATAGDYIGRQPFHTYYMTVSGHMNYNFDGNQMAKKNKSFVAGLPYSDASKAYIACNLELEFAVKTLVDKLEDAGIAENTVIAISPDHYPYGLPRECIDELAGHKVENNFELYKSVFILWKKGMDPVEVDKPCSSLDINPTLSNLFGLEYDSRLLMGRDILSDAPPLVIFSNWSWLTDKARYNAVTDKVTYAEGINKDADYAEAVNKAVAQKFKYSESILDTDYYKKVVP